MPLWRLILLISLLRMVAAAQPPLLVANSMWASSKETPWESGPPGSACQRYQGDSGWHSADEVWCRLCTREMPGFSKTSAYYVLDQLASTDCRLGQFRATSAPLSPSLADQLHRALSERLQKQFGPGKDPGRVQGWGAAYWKSLRLFESRELWVLLFINFGPGPFPSTTPHVEILARHAKLVSLIEQDKQASGFQAEYRQQRNRRLDRKLAQELAATLPKLASLLEPDNPDASTLRAHIEILWRMASATSAPPKPLLLLAIDRLAEKLASSLNNERAESEAVARKQTSAGLVHQHSHLGAVWVYTRNLPPAI